MTSSNDQRQARPTTRGRPPTPPDDDEGEATVIGKAPTAASPSGVTPRPTRRPTGATGPVRTGATGPVRTGATGPVRGATGPVRGATGPARAGATGPIAAPRGPAKSGVSPAPRPAAAPKPALAARAAAAASTRAQQDDPLIGTVIEDRYQLERLLGSGGMSRVYLGTHLRAGGKLAIKLIDLRLSNKPDMIQRCLQEARTMMEIQSNYVVRAYDVGVLPSGQLYIVMEHLAGDDLEQLVTREGPLAWPRLADMAVQICSGLSAAHKRGTIHRDIKPQNCFRVPLDGNPDHIKLIDFGIARDANAEVGLTQDGMILGTPEYMAPELVVAGHPPDVRSDIYALGAMLYKLLTGNAPFRGRDALDTLYQHRNSPVIPPSKAAPQLDIPAAADEILLRALAKSPKDRYDSAEDMARALRASLGMRSIVMQLPESTGPVPPINESTSPGRLAPSQEISTFDLRPVTRRDVAIRGATLLSLSLFFGVASWIAAPPQTPSALLAPAGPTADETTPAESTPAEPTTPEPLVEAPAEPVPAIVAEPAPVEPVPAIVAEPAPVEPVPAIVAEPEPEPEPEPESEPEPDSPTAGGAPEPNFDYKSARKYVDEQRDYLLKTCLIKAAKPASRLGLRVDVRPNGRPTVKVFSSSSEVRDCARKVLSFNFDSSPRGGAFTYTLTAGGGTFEKQPVDPAIVK